MREGGGRGSEYEIRCSGGVEWEIRSGCGVYCVRAVKRR